ncbi:dihydroorotate dehydrogenase [Candidatus Thorarchaeota archaeon]|nr:MAG: dihydroorotate dehydrogenase [Candidatus Thorarchaeota archaeon]
MKIQGYWLASGILGVTASTMLRVLNSGADAVVTKSIGLHPRTGHNGPVLATSHGGLLNAVGLTNPGIDAFEEEMQILREVKVPIIMSIFADSPKEIAIVAEKAATLGPSAIELNLSCPHAEISQISHSPTVTTEYVQAVKEVVDLPVFAKLTPNATDYVSVGKAAQKAGADAIVAINTVRAMKIDILQQRPVLGNKTGGLSGPPIFPIAVRCVYDLHNALAIPIIGVGGVSTWKDAVEMHLAGASAIQIGTAVMEDIEVFSKIKNGVQTYLKERGHKSIDEIVGAAGGTN